MAEKLTHAVSAFPWGRLVAKHASDLREAPVQPKTRQQRTAFDGPGTTSTVTLAVKPRQTYKRGPGIAINSEASRRDAEKRMAMRWSRI